VIVVVDAFAHGKDDAPAVETDFRVAYQRGRAGIKKGGDFPAFGNLQHLEYAGRIVFFGIVFAGLEDGSGVVVVFPVLAADDEQNRLDTDQRVGRQRFALELFEFRTRRAVSSRLRYSWPFGYLSRRQPLNPR